MQEWEIGPPVMQRPNRPTSREERLKCPMEVLYATSRVGADGTVVTTLCAAGHAQERRVICVLVDDLGFGASIGKTAGNSWLSFEMRW